jgi:hypothetical protein
MQAAAKISPAGSCSTVHGNDRKQCVHVRTTKGMPLSFLPLRGIQMGAFCPAWSMAPVRTSSAMICRRLAAPPTPLAKKASARTPAGTALDEYAPLAATTMMLGNLRRTTDSSSKPDISGMLRSDRITSGICCFSCNRASKPSVAVETSYPAASSTVENVKRTVTSSSTIRTRVLEGFGMNTPQNVVSRTLGSQLWSLKVMRSDHNCTPWQRLSRSARLYSRAMRVQQCGGHCP